MDLLLVWFIQVGELNSGIYLKFLKKKYYACHIRFNSK